MRSLDQRNYYFAIACFTAVFDQSDITIADVLIDHGVALYSDGINVFRSDPTQQKARHGNGFRLRAPNYLHRHSRGDSTRERNLAESVRRCLNNSYVEGKRSVFMAACDQAASFKRRDVLGNRRS